MARKMIAFLGNKLYQPTTYQWQGQQVTTSFFAQALCQFFSPIHTLYVFVTEEAKKETLPALTEHLAKEQAEIQAGSQTVIRPIDIPTGKDETGLWQIFQSCASVLNDGDEVIFDITHGFRSIPLLAFLASIYVRSLKKVKLAGIYYGAYEARLGEITPVFDLTSFVRLLDWTVAVSHFTSSGDARQLSNLLIETQKEIQAPSASGQVGEANDTRIFDEASGRHAPSEAPPNRLQSLASLLDNLSTGLRVNRPIEVMQEAALLDGKVKEARTEVERWAPAFALLLDQVNQEFGQFALPNPWAKSDYQDNLTRTLAMIKWYVSNRQYLQAYTVAREWVVTLVAVLVKADPLHQRREIEDLLGTQMAMKRRRGATYRGGGKKWEASFNELPKKVYILNVWDTLSKQRNDLAHAGMNRRPTTSERVERNAQRLPGLLEKLRENVTRTNKETS